MSNKIICSQCSLDLASFDEFIEHLYDKHDEDSYTSSGAGLRCPFCAYDGFASGGELAMHCMYMHQPPAAAPTHPPGTSQDGVVGSNPPGGGQGQSASDDECYACPLCDFVATRADLVEIHVNQLHYDEGTSGAARGVSSGHKCPVCARSYDDPELLSVHVNEHFEEGSVVRNHPSTSRVDSDDANIASKLQEEENKRLKLAEAASFRILQSQYGMDEVGSYSQQATESLERDMQNGRISFDSYLNSQYHLQRQTREGREENNYSVKALINRIRDMGQRMPDVAELLLCTPSIEHCSTSRGDHGWGCGYRNVQMLLSSLRREPSFREALGDGVYPGGYLPSIPHIQLLIERAWEAGFDAMGRQQLNGKVKDSRKWIGTTEASIVFLHRGVKVELVDFHRPTGPDRTHPKMFEYVYNYFRHHHVNNTFCPPLYLQHEGHSRTIVGVERLKPNARATAGGGSVSPAAGTSSSPCASSSSDSEDTSYRLLIFDPGHPRNRMLTCLTSDNPNHFKIFRKRLQDMKNPQFQLMAIRGIITSPSEMQHFKRNIPFARIP